MDILLIVLVVLALLVGVIGCIIPALPGPPIAYLSLVALRFHEHAIPDNKTMLWYGLAVAIVTVLDYYLPIWGTKQFGGTNAGKRGSIIGLILGLVFPILGPFTILIGPFVGAVVGETLAGQSNQTALRSGIGSFLGFVGGTLLKLGMVIAIIRVVVLLLW